MTALSTYTLPDLAAVLAKLLASGNAHFRNPAGKETGR